MKDKKKQIILSILGILSLVLITAGVTYAVFTYTKLGSIENTVTAGTLKFLYTENAGVGAGISLTNAFPVSDTVGKTYTTEGEVFDFKVESTNTSNENISYEVTLRQKSNSTLPNNAVKVYLTDMTEGTDTEILTPTLYSSLTNTSIDVGEEIEKTLYQGTVPGGKNDYSKIFRLRMWISEDTDFSPNEDGTYLYNNKTFTVTVNIYANAKVVTEEDIVNESKAEISSLSVNGTELTAVTDQGYDYEITLDEGTTSATINLETISEYATVNIERIDSLAYSSNVKRLSTQKTLDLNSGNNYFKITVTNEASKAEKEYILKIYVDEGTPTLSSAIFSKYTTIYENPTLTTSSNNTNDASGLYKSTLTNSEDPTYYFRGDVENYLDFAGFTWRVVRINEDGTIRIVMQDGINNNVSYRFNPTYSGYTYMYYSNSNVKNGAKYTLDNWYNTNIASNATYANRVVTGEYFCEEAKVKYSSDYTSGNATMKVYNDTTYTPSFSCSEDDGNRKGIVNASVGLITYDEVLHAGGYYGKSNSSYYLYNSAINWWTMSPAGVTSYSNANAWNVTTAGDINNNAVTRTIALRPVLNLKADTAVTGLGTSDSHWAVTN